MKFNEKLICLRKAAGFSQEELAEKLGVSRQAISRWEAGSTLPDAVNLLGLSDLFRVTVDSLLRDDEDLVPTDIPAENAGQVPDPAAPAFSSDKEEDGTSYDRRRRNKLIVLFAVLLPVGIFLLASGFVFWNYIVGALWLMWISLAVGAACLFGAGFCGFRLYLVTHSGTAEEKTQAQGKLAMVAAAINLFSALCFSFMAGLSGMAVYWFLTALLLASSLMEFAHWRKLRCGK